jgi:hypothetical protein
MAPISVVPRVRRAKRPAMDSGARHGPNDLPTAGGADRDDSQAPRSSRAVSRAERVVM